MTLSHEALELAFDPEVNRLVQDPHPEPGEADRPVFHLVRAVRCRSE